MEVTSGAYNPYASVIRSSANISFELIDVNAINVASVSANVAAAPFTATGQTIDHITQMTRKIATFEPNQWQLDGTWRLPRRKGVSGEVGWWSDSMSDADGEFATAPKLTYMFSALISCASITVVFDDKAGEVCEAVNLTAYRNNAVIAQGAIIDNNNATCVIPLAADGFNRLEVDFIKTKNPLRRVRICEVIFGELKQFDANELTELRVVRETSLYMDALATSMLQVTLDNSDGAYNVLNPQGIYRFLQEGQGINASITVNDESINMGRFYFSKATANDDALTATITAYDKISRLDAATYDIGVEGQFHFATAVDSIISESGIDISVDIPDDIGARVIGTNIPRGTSCREALRLAAQAAMTHIWIDRNDRLIARDINWGNVDDIITADNMSGWGSASDAGRINTVYLNVSNDYAETEATYTATSRRAGEPILAITVDNPLPRGAARGQAVADWLLSIVNHNNYYNIQTMGNPARGVGDCANIANRYGTTENAVIIKQTTTYNGAVLDQVEAYGGGR